MKNIISINCPSCGGTLNILEGDKNVICEYCGSEYVLTSKIGIERYYVKPLSNLKENFVRNRKFIENRIVFIPILKVRTEIFGWVYAHKKGKKVTYQDKDERGRLRTYTVTIDENWLKKPVNVFREDKFNLLKNMRLGQERIEIEGFELTPYDDEKMHTFGSVIDLLEDIDIVKKNALKNIMERFLSQYSEYDELKYDLDFVLPNFSIIYYPVLILRDDKGFYSIDGVRGKIIYKEEKETIKKRLKLKKYFIPLFTLLISLFSYLNIFAGIFLFLIFLILLIYSYGD
uniref:TFIIB-type zinc ribbon-containing protein n=1 Tax=candidate division WOR-3 bacterium TaxID=2052148 RepID=A0A7C4U7Q1_UNCW3